MKKIIIKYKDECDYSWYSNEDENEDENEDKKEDKNSILSRFCEVEEHLFK